MARIVLDPGHGGWNTIPNDSTWNNAVGPHGTLEKNLTLPIALLARDALAAMGHDVRMTRTTDMNLRLRDRARVAFAFNAHVFVSIHLNGSTNHNAQGTETLVHTDYSPMSARLSLHVQDAVLAVTKLTDRNRTYNPATRIKPQSLAVLRPSYHRPSTAACLVEVSFLDQAAEEARLNNAAYRRDVAGAIARGVNEYAQLVAPAATAAAPGKAFGDAIEAEADTAGSMSKIVAYLDLATAQVSTSGDVAKNTEDSKEKVLSPAKPFSKALVEGSFSAMTLVKGDNWSLMSEFQDFIAALDLKHFAADEFLEKGGGDKAGKCKGKNAFPPKPLWKNIANTARMLDLIRSELGAPVRTLSVYRSPDYNKCIGGENASLHMKFNAIDFTCGSGTPEIWRRVAAEIRKSDKRFTGGVGIYTKSNFLHIDTRGYDANWGS